MFYAITVAVSAAIVWAIMILPPDRFTDKIRKNPILGAVLIFDLLFVGGNLILHAAALQIVPTVNFVTAMILTVTTFLSAFFQKARKKQIIVLTSVFAALFVMAGVSLVPKNHGIKEFDGETYVGITTAADELDKWKNIYYYRSDNPLVISKNYGVVENYGVVHSSDWDAIKGDVPYQIDYYENGERVDTEYPWY